MNTTTKTLSALAGLALITGTASAATVHSFNMTDQAAVMNGDAPLNVDGLVITGEGDWTNHNFTSAATDDGVTLTFNALDVSYTPQWRAGNRGSGLSRAIGTASFWANDDILFTFSGLSANTAYNIVFYDKNVIETRSPNVGIDGFDAGNGVGASAPWDAEGDQNFAGVVSSGTGTITGRWYLAGGQQDITAIAGIQLQAVPEPSSLALLGLGGLLVARRRRG